MSDIKQPTDITRQWPGDITQERYEMTSFLVRCTRGCTQDLDAAAARRGISRNAFVLRALARVIEGEPQ